MSVDRPAGLRLPSPLEEVHDDRFARRGVRVLLKRDDLIHPDIPGNKWRKLEHNLTAAAGRPLLTFGGAYSHHIRATAVAGRLAGLATVGVIRGEPHAPLNPVLAAAAAHGMTLTYLDRLAYRRKHTPAVLDALRREFGDVHVVPEGGGNRHGVRGCAALPAEIDVEFDVVCCATGTGTTLAGIAAGLGAGRRAIGFAALKGGAFLHDEVRRLQREHGRVTENFAIETGFHFGGYARNRPDLEDFIADFRRRHRITLDRVYEAKMMVGISTLVERGRFPPGTTLVAVVA